MLGALDRMFRVKKIMNKLTHKEFPFLISCWKMLADTVVAASWRVEQNKHQASLGMS